MSAKNLKQVGAVELRLKLREILEKVFFKGDTVAVTRYNGRIMAVIISPGEYDRLCGLAIARVVEERAEKKG